MEREQAKELWSRLVSGEALTAAEETLLLNRLLERPVLRREFVEDATLDSELRCLARLDSPKDDFLQGFAKKLSEDRGLFLFNRFPADGGGPKKALDCSGRRGPLCHVPAGRDRSMVAHTSCQ